MRCAFTTSYPVWTPDTINYRAGISYSATIKQMGRSDKFQITHVIKGKSLLNEFIEKGEAAFAVQYRVKNTVLRKTEELKEPKGHSEYEQIISIQDCEGLFPVFSPFIFMKKGKRIKPKPHHGLSKLWEENKEISFPSHGKIALDTDIGFNEDATKLRNLFSIRPMKDWEAGWVRVTLSKGFTQNESPPFIVSCSQNIVECFRDLGSESQTETYQMLRTYILASAYAIVQREVFDLKTWDEEIEFEDTILGKHCERMPQEAETTFGNTEFNPALAASKMYPLLTRRE